MNSISYLDSVLTRSLTSSRTASGSATPANDAAESSRLNRRASDYSLSKQRDRERRRIAASLGFSTIDSHDEQEKKPRSSKRSSRSGSTKGSDLEGPAERSRISHPKASSEGRARVKRMSSTPAPMRNSLSSSKWGGLWGLGGWLDSNESNDWHSQRREASSGKQRLLFPQDAIIRGSVVQRRASTSDAEAALVNIAPDALLSEREREDVVDFEGYDPEEDLHPGIGSSAPPSTPFTTGDTTPLKDSSKRNQRSRSNTGASTGSRLSAILFGALNPLTDDYFGPQPAETSTLPPPNRRKKSDDGTEKKRLKEQKRKGTTNELSEKNVLLLESSAEKEGDSSSKDGRVALPSEPPPPYSDVASSTTSASLLLPSPTLEALRGSSRSSSARRRLAALILQGFRGALIFLRRMVVAIVLSPVRAAKFLFQTRGGTHKVIVEIPQNGLERKRSGKRFQTSSQAERPSAARHQVGRRQADVSDDGSSSDELVTEEQAEARAHRKAARRKAMAEEEAAVEKSTALLKAEAISNSNRLLPNPNPIDPLLAHDRAAKPVSPDSPSALTLSPGNVKGLTSGAVINRGPLSSLIHHSPKVLVLDLDETLIHSTSRSPTWGALTDKTKGRAAVTTGGGLLGLEGLGGIMGLQGQVGVRPHQVEVVLDGRSIIYHVYKRPHVDHFLRKVAAWYHVVIFTASVQEYADPVIDWLDQGRGLVGTRLFRESCTYRNGSYLKNLAHVDADLSRICLVDNSPASYLINQANGIPIEGWTHDPNDEGLLDLLPVLDSLRFASDVRHILGLRGFLDSKLNGQGQARRV